MNTPLEKVFQGFETDNIPFPFKEQFLATPDRPYDVVLEGVMHEIWHRPAWLGPLFKYLGKLGVLVPQAGKNIPTTLEVVPGVDTKGRPYHEWNRTFSFPRPIKFNTTVVFDEKWEDIADQVGPGKRLHMVWAGRYHPPGTFTLNTISNGLRLFGRVWYLPRWLWNTLLGRVDFVQTAHPERENQVDVDLRIIHPWLGEVFGYRGTFIPKRIMKKV